MPYFKMISAFLSIFLQANLVQSATTQVDIAAKIIYQKTRGEVCALRGTLSSPSVITTFNVPADNFGVLTYCSNACFTASSSQNCKAFYVDEEFRRCRLFDKTFDQMGFKKNTADSGPQFYGLDCFKTTYDSKMRTILTEVGPLYDDETFRVTFPFPINYYKGFNYTYGYMHINGFLSFIEPAGISNDNQPLPSYDDPDPYKYLPGNSIAVYWDDLELENANPGCFSCINGRRLEMSVTGVAPNREVTFGWYVLKRGQQGVLDIEMVVKERTSHVLEIFYRAVDATYGWYATIGFQSKLVGKYAQVGYNAFQAVRPLSRLVMDTGTNKFTYYPSG